MKRTKFVWLGVLTAFVAAVWMICVYRIRNGTADIVPRKPRPHGTWRTRRKPPIDPSKASLDQVRALVNTGEYTLVDFDRRFQKNLEMNNQAHIYMTEGQPVPFVCYPEVVAVEVGSFLCTGTVISEHQVLTAAHCFQGSDRACNVFVGPCHPGGVKFAGQGRCFTEPCKTSKPDIAIIEVRKDIGVAPREIAPKNTSDSQSALLAIGMGVDEDEKVGSKKMAIFTTASSSCTLAVSLNVQVADRKYYSCEPGRQLVAAKAQNIPAVCSGDSGGPVMASLDQRSGRYAVVGIIESNDGVCRTDNIFTRVDTDEVLKFLAPALSRRQRDFARPQAICVPHNPPDRRGLACP